MFVGAIYHEFVDALSMHSDARDTRRNADELQKPSVSGHEVVTFHRSRQADHMPPAALASSFTLLACG